MQQDEELRQLLNSVQDGYSGFVECALAFAVSGGIVGDTANFIKNSDVVKADAVVEFIERKRPQQEIVIIDDDEVANA